MASYILQELPESMSDGKKVLYPKMQSYSLEDYKSVLKKMHDYSGSFSEGTMMGVLDALITTMTSWMPEGHSIKIDGLGIFSVSLGFDTDSPSERLMAEAGREGQDESEPKQKYRRVCIKGINFKPAPELIEAMNKTTTFERVMKEVKVPRRNPFTREQRLAIALELIERNGQMTLTDYVRAAELERSAASRELKRFVEDPESGITSRGSKALKVWVKG
ncbi:MAG: hypothetical protein IJR87_05175 [Bacteroidaceae bacterium]|nr:hypothetical protein [Bacteroidaceae bacterium]